MAIEGGGKNAVIEADKVTFDYVKKRTNKPYTVYRSDPDVNYYFRKSYDASTMEPVVAKPHSPDNKALVNYGSKYPKACGLSSQANSRITSWLRILSYR